MPPVRLLLLSDTHVGLDLPLRPRIRRRRRGHDLLVNFERALEPARAGRVDLVVHGGDLLFRSRVPPELVQRAVRPLMRVADLGVPVFLVPGNHERSAVPYPLLARHPLLHIFDRPRSFRLTCAGWRVALAGWPFARDAGPRCAGLLRDTGWRPGAADIDLLCLHQAVEGARVGAHDFVFRPGGEVIRRRDLPADLSAVLCGHVHRAQVLDGPVPVLYPGSVERTSLAERLEPKGYLRLELRPGQALCWRFVELPARPLVLLTPRSRNQLRRQLARTDPNAVVTVRGGGLGLSAPRLRAMVPPTMNIELARPRRS